MNTLLVPTDFSDTAKNAALYAAEFARNFTLQKIVLFNAYQAPLSVEPSIPALQLFSLEDVKQISSDGLVQLKAYLHQYAGDNIQIETINEFGNIADSVNETCQKTNTDLVIMGITGGNGLDVLIGSNTVEVANTAQIPVLIVPATRLFKPVKNILLVIDMKKPPFELSLSPVKKLLDDTKAKLHVLHIDELYNNEAENRQFSPYKFLNGYNPEYHQVYSKNFTDAVNEFAEGNGMDMIITISKKHGFF